MEIYCKRIDFARIFRAPIRNAECPAPQELPRLLQQQHQQQCCTMRTMRKTAQLCGAQTNQFSPRMRARTLSDKRARAMRRQLMCKQPKQSYIRKRSSSRASSSARLCVCVLCVCVYLYDTQDDQSERASALLKEEFYARAYAWATIPGRPRARVVHT